MGGGGGGDYEAQQAAIDAKKQKARDALNVMFGVAPTASAAPQAMPGRLDWAGAGASAEPRAPATPAPDLTAEAATNKAARDALYTKVRTDAFDSGKRRFDETKEKAARNNKFALFAQGLNGGSADIDENAQLARTYGQGLLDLGAKADSAKTDMLGNDEQTRLGLLQSIDSGMDQGSALSSALGQLKVNSDRAASSAQGTDLGDLFGGAGLLYTKSNYARGANGQAPWSLFSGGNPMYTPAGMRNPSGILSSTGGR